MVSQSRHETILFVVRTQHHAEEVDLYLLRYRNIKGELVREYTRTPYHWPSVPSLGETADLVTDAFRFPHTTVNALDATYREAHEIARFPELYFIENMVKKGMPLEEAELFWGLIDMPSKAEVRERFLLNTISRR